MKRATPAAQYIELEKVAVKAVAPGAGRTSKAATTEVVPVPVDVCSGSVV